MRLFTFFIAVLLSATSSVSAQVINEFQPNPPGQDPDRTLIEIKGEPSQLFSGKLLFIEGDNDSKAIDKIVSVSGRFDENGLLVVETTDLENPSFTIVLTNSAVFVSRGDVANITDLAASTFDAIGIPDRPADEATVYGDELGGTDFKGNFEEPEIVFRDGVSNELYSYLSSNSSYVLDKDHNQVVVTDFDKAIANTYGDVNPTTVSAPVELTDFKVVAINKTAQLSWTTATESANDFFAVERSADGRVFNEIDRVAGAGDSQVGVAYSAVDALPLAGVSYYRLRQLDLDGTATIYGPIAFRNENSNDKPAAIFPNPVRKEIKLSNTPADISQLSIINLNGQSVLTLDADLAKANSSIEVNELPAGVYFLRYFANGAWGQIRFVKQ